VAVCVAECWECSNARRRATRSSRSALRSSSRACAAATCIRQHTSALPLPAYVSIRQHTSALPRALALPLPAYVSIRQHTSAYVNIRQDFCGADRGRGIRQHTPAAYVNESRHLVLASAHVSIRQQHTAYVIMRSSWFRVSGFGFRLVLG
jgi:hypothetical protein